MFYSLIWVVLAFYSLSFQVRVITGDMGILACHRESRMLIVKLDTENSIVLIEPTGSLDAKDFKAAASTIDPFIEKCGELKGLIIHTESFPGWDSFSALLSHLKFVKNHHTHIKRIAFATDSVIGTLAESLVSHFVEAEIKRFTYAELEQAKQWIVS